jgi:signal peptidase I
VAPGDAPARRPLRRDLAWIAAALALALAARGSLMEPHLVASGSMAPTLLPGDVLLVSRLAYAVRLPFTDVLLARLESPRRGDVVVLRDPTASGRRLVKRVVGLPGETVELREQALLVDGVVQPRLELGELTYREPGDDGEPEREVTCRRWRELVSLGAAGGRPAGEPAPSDPEAWADGLARVAAGTAMGHDLLQCRRLRAGRREGPYGPVRPGHVFVLGDNRDRSTDSRAGWEVPVAGLVGRASLVAWSWGPGGRWPWGERGARIDRLFKPVE